MISRRTRRRIHLANDISLTPLIDTALTLLIIFMVATPMLHNAIKLELPKGSVQEASKQAKRLIVSVDKQGLIYFNDAQVTLDKLPEALTACMAKPDYAQEQSVWLRVNGATTTCDTLAALYDKIKEVSGIKDVQIAMEKPRVSTASAMA